MKKADLEKEMRNEFIEFIEADHFAPSEESKNAVMDMVLHDLNPAPLKVYSKFALIQTSSGLLTLAVCPQFGVGTGQHDEFLHSIHAAMPPVVFYLLCGVFFVLLGAVVSGLILNRSELKTIGNMKFACFAIFGVLAYLALVALGTEEFVANSLVWIAGAFFGNIFGFELATRLQGQAKAFNS